MLLKEARSRRRTCTGRRRPKRPSCPSEATLPRGRDTQHTAETHRPFRRAQATGAAGLRPGVAPVWKMGHPISVFHSDSSGVSFGPTA